MNELIQLADCIRRRNSLELEITALIGRPAQIGHIGEYIASRIFSIDLEKSASHKSIDGHFVQGTLTGRSVNIKWYAYNECLLDITPEAVPDYYLVLTGSKTRQLTSLGRPRPWTIDFVFLFDAQALVRELRYLGVKIGVATSVRQDFWKQAEVYPSPNNELLLSEAQQQALKLFGSQP